MVELGHVPNGHKEILEYYGNPGSSQLTREYASTQMTLITLPYIMRASWDNALEISKAYVHKAVANSLYSCFLEISKRMPYLYMDLAEQNICGGFFNFRLKRGSRKELSTHSWGIAVDLNPHIAPLNKRSFQPKYIVETFESHGWVNLEHDGMHFQACSGY